jgi:hypothetical protein
MDMNRYFIRQFIDFQLAFQTDADGRRQWFGGHPFRQFRTELGTLRATNFTPIWRLAFAAAETTFLPDT